MTGLHLPVRSPSPVVVTAFMRCQDLPVAVLQKLLVEIEHCTMLVKAQIDDGAVTLNIF